MKKFKLLSLSAVLVTLFFAIPVFAQKLKSEEILAKHLDSIASPDMRATIKNQIAVGDANAKFISQKNQIVQGRIVMASEGQKNFFGLSMNSNAYPGERFSYDGKKAKVAFVQSGSRSVLGNFLQANTIAIEESLLGGTLSTSWLMLNTPADKGKFTSEGIKKLDGRDAYVLGYSRKGGSDVDVVLYFDKDTFRHVRTEYKRTSSAGIGRTPEQSSGFSETRLKIIEDFADFKLVKGITLPHSYRILYSNTGQNGTTEIEWNFNLTEFAFNQKLDGKTFDADTN